MVCGALDETAILMRRDWNGTGRDERRRDGMRRDEIEVETRHETRLRLRLRRDEIETRRDETRRNETRQDKTRQDKTKLDETRQDKTRLDKTRRDEASFFVQSSALRAVDRVGVVC
jgi:hypothetical protein